MRAGAGDGTWLALGVLGVAALATRVVARGSRSHTGYVFLLVVEKDDRIADVTAYNWRQSADEANSIRRKELRAEGAEGSQNWDTAIAMLPRYNAGKPFYVLAFLTGASSAFFSYHALAEARQEAHPANLSHRRLTG